MQPQTGCKQSSGSPFGTSEDCRWLGGGCMGQADMPGLLRKSIGSSPIAVGGTAVTDTPWKKEWVPSLRDTAAGEHLHLIFPWGGRVGDNLSWGVLITLFRVVYFRVFPRVTGVALVIHTPPHSLFRPVSKHGGGGGRGGPSFLTSHTAWGVTPRRVGRRRRDPGVRQASGWQTGVI